VTLAHLERRFVEFNHARCYGVYLFVLDGTIVYVGQTTDLSGRIRLHDSSKFDRILWIEITDREERLDTEKALIRALKPRFNSNASKRGARDREILHALGLPDYSDSELKTWLAEHSAVRRKKLRATRRRRKLKAS
jgi:predicted GIY-YIG superfamily endonuclease